MKTLQVVGSLLLLSATFITPASANWFSSQSSNTMYNVGSREKSDAGRIARAV